ncbi:MAG: DUF1015 domain-containing protein [Eubacterium sp.]|nr:DUF1015 domain-containing protein [Eubacterium sp.]
MAVFKSFKAYRPSKENQSLIPAPPYDVMNSEEAREMVKGNPLSFLHVDRAEIDFEPGFDMYSPEVYKRARENLLSLEEGKKLIQDDKPCLYIYRLVMGGRSQTGLVGCASIDDYINNVIKKHEHTLAKKEQDRINHVNVCDANTGPIFLTYRDDNEVNSIVNSWTRTKAPVYDFNSQNVYHTVWVIDDDETIKRLENAFKGISSLYIADGHHRCASAVKVGEMRRKENPDYNGSEEFNFFLAIVFPDSELEIMDYNRVVKDLNGLTFDEFIERVEEKFEVSTLPAAKSPEEKHTVSMLYHKKWYSLKAKEGTFDENDPVSQLDVSILQNNLLNPILGIDNPKTNSRIEFIGGIRGLGELERRTNEDMEIAFAMYPTTVEDLMSIADAGAIMPPKSTWFEPKPLSGIFIHHLS